MRTQRCRAIVYVKGELTELQKVGHKPLKRSLYSLMTPLCVFAYNTTATQNKLNNKSRLCSQNIACKAGLRLAERETNMPYCGWTPFSKSLPVVFPKWLNARAQTCPRYIWKVKKTHVVSNLPRCHRSRQTKCLLRFEFLVWACTWGEQRCRQMLFWSYFSLWVFVKGVQPWRSINSTNYNPHEPSTGMLFAYINKKRADLP